MATTPLLISREEVRQLLDWEAVYGATREGLILAASSNTNTSLSAQVPYSLGALHLKAAAIESQNIISVKSNLRPNRGGVSGVLLAYDLASEKLTGVIDAGLMTAMRTGAIAAVAAKRFVRGTRVSVAVLGAGPVGAQSIRGLLRVLDVERVNIWSGHVARSATLAGELRDDVESAAFESVAEATTGCDVIVTATPATHPILEGNHLDHGVVILAMGADTAGKRELSPDVLDSADIVADAPDDALRVGECAYLPADRHASVGAIGTWLTTEDEMARRRPWLVIDSVGSSHVDAAVTSLIMSRALERGLGRPIEW